MKSQKPGYVYHYFNQGKLTIRSLCSPYVSIDMSGGSTLAEILSSYVTIIGLTRTLICTINVLNRGPFLVLIPLCKQALNRRCSIRTTSSVSEIVNRLGQSFVFPTSEL